MVKVFIADDHTVVRAGLKQILSEIENTVVVDEACDAHEVLSKAPATECDVILLDITMPGANGLDVLNEIKSKRPELPVIILSVHAEDQYAIPALKAGASGYLTKESAPDDLEKALHKVIEGGLYVSSSLGEKLALELIQPSQQLPHETLSDREYQVMRLIVAGQRVKDIAEKLSLSSKSVTTYRSRILKKLCMQTNAELIAYALEKRLLD